MATISTHKRWLKVSAVTVGFAGPIFFFGSMEPTAELARFGLDVLSLPVDGAQSFEAPTTRFLSALTGGFLFGWGVLIWCLSGAVFDAEPEAVRRALLAGFLAWFVLDSAGSIASGNLSNVFFNVLVVLPLVGPMWKPATR